MNNILEMKNALTNIQNIETCDDYLKLRANLTNNSQFGLQSPSKLASFPALDDFSTMKDNLENHPENSNKRKYKKHNDTVFETGNTTNLQSEFDYPTHKTRMEDDQIDRQQFLRGIEQQPDNNNLFESSFDDDSTLQDINKMFNFGKQKQGQQQRTRPNQYQSNNQRKQSDIYSNYNANRQQKNFGYQSRKYDNTKQVNTIQEDNHKAIENSDIKAYLESIEKRFKITTNNNNNQKQSTTQKQVQSLLQNNPPQSQQQQKIPPSQKQQKQTKKQQKTSKNKQKSQDLSVIQDDVFGEEFNDLHTAPQKVQPKESQKRIFFSKTSQQQEVSLVSTTVDTKAMMENEIEGKQIQKKKKKDKKKKSKCCKKCEKKHKHKHRHQEEESSSSENSEESEESQSSKSDDDTNFSSNKKQQNKKQKKKTFNDSFDEYDDKASQISSANSIYSDLIHSQALSHNNIAYLKQKYGRNSASIQNRLNYLIQQRKKVQDSQDEMEEVFCIDCEEYIKIENVESHANFCRGKKHETNSLIDDSRTLFDFDNFQGDNTQLELHEYNSKMKKYLGQLKEKLKNFADKSIPTSEFTAICEICCLQIECIQQIILNNCSNQDLTTQISDLAILNKHLLTIQRNRIYNIVKLSARIRNIAKHKQILLFPSPTNQNLQKTHQQNSNINQTQLVVSQFTSPTKTINQQYMNKNSQNTSNIPMNSIHCNSKDELLKSPSSIFSSISQRNDQIQESQITRNPSNQNLFKKKPFQQSQEKMNQNLLEQFSELNAFSTILNQAVENSVNNQQISFPQTKLQQQCNEQIQNERKKQFFSIVMKAKQQLPQNHPGRNALINDLYQQAQIEKISVEKWEEYIITQLKAIK